MQIRNDKNRITKEVELNDIVWIGADKYQVCGFTNTSIRLKLISTKYCSSTKEKECYNKNTFAKRYFFDKDRCTWNATIIRRMPNMDYM